MYYQVNDEMRLSFYPQCQSFSEKLLGGKIHLLDQCHEILKSGVKGQVREKSRVQEVILQSRHPASTDQQPFQDSIRSRTCSSGQRKHTTRNLVNSKRCHSSRVREKRSKLEIRKNVPENLTMESCLRYIYTMNLINNSEC